MGKPVHPAAVHFPIAFLSLSFALDIIYTTQARLPKSIQDSLPVSTEMTRLSYFLLSAGLIMAVPALVTGIREAIVLINKQGIKDAEGNVRDKVKALIAHAVMNDAMLAITTYVWWVKRAAAKGSLTGKIGVATYAPEPRFVMVEALLLVLLMMASNIGGVLAYNFGIGFQAASSANKKKQ